MLECPEILKEDWLLDFKIQTYFKEELNNARKEDWQNDWAG